jgi:hypothetical protein
MVNEMYEKVFKGKDVTLFAKVKLENGRANWRAGLRQVTGFADEELRDILIKNEEMYYICKITPLLNFFSSDFVGLPSEVNSNFRELRTYRNSPLGIKYDKYYDRLFVLLTEKQKKNLFGNYKPKPVFSQFKVKIFEKVFYFFVFLSL